MNWKSLLNKQSLIVAFYITIYSTLPNALHALEKGMTPKEVRLELGRPTSVMGRGDQTFFKYDDRKLTFVDGRLISDTHTDLDAVQAPPPVSAPKPPIEAAPTTNTALEPAQEPANSPQQSAEFSNNPQFLESVDSEAIYQDVNQNEIFDDLQNALDEYEDAQTFEKPSLYERLIWVAVTFIFDVVLTALILKGAFHINGAESLWPQIFTLSLIIASVGALLHYFLHAGLGNPVRSGIGFFLTLLLIQPLTDVKDWPTIIKITIVSRLLSIAAGWLLLGLIAIIVSQFI